MHWTFITTSLLAFTALACPDHEYHSMRKRADAGADWKYTDAHTWGLLKPDYGACQEGSHQAPIGLRTDQGFASNQPKLEGYEKNHPEGDFKTLPHLTFNEAGKTETVYMSAWHIHAPGEHTVNGKRTRAEMHFVHVTAEGKPRAVLALRIDPGTQDSEFFKQLPPLISHTETGKQVDATVNIGLALDEVDRFARSLTTPPCTEGIRFFVARDILFVSDEQMKALLHVSQYSARPEQQVWQHQINV
ncbi:hypothetical protein QFC20_003577 [Naganishia adeliensis]|uniref:Uncharacterized protein n=1 Tax=Naganishia adeliensis TaxID=92952 RepID=A0ACC2W8E4_9TREE|nr:hypothetical protein QFC20_003577 [Naganishia adeliensis]